MKIVVSAWPAHALAPVVVARYAVQPRQLVRAVHKLLFSLARLGEGAAGEVCVGEQRIEPQHLRWSITPCEAGQVLAQRGLFKPRVPSSSIRKRALPLAQRRALFRLNALRSETGRAG